MRARLRVMRRIGLLLAASVGVLLLGCSPESSNPNKDAQPRSAASSPDDGTAEAVPNELDVTLTVGHCFVEPIHVAGRDWVTRRDLGYGGWVPKGFTEDGTFVVLNQTEATFLATGGAEVAFKVAPDPLLLRSCR